MGCDGDSGTVGGDAVTTLLYHPGSYLCEIEAAVTRVEGKRVALDRTVFHRLLSREEPFNGIGEPW